MSEVPNDQGEPITPSLERLRHEVDRWLDLARTGGEKALEAVGLSAALKGARLACDVCEFPDRYEVMIDVPGCTASQLDLAVTGNTLHLKVFTTERIATSDAVWRLTERLAGTSERHLTLSATVDADSVAADLKNGVLLVKVNKVVEPGRRVPISGM